VISKATPANLQKTKQTKDDHTKNKESCRSDMQQKPQRQ
jgi:hypothetical protein